MDERQECVKLIDEAVSSGARIEVACECLELSSQTYRSWKSDANQGDRRQGPLSPPASRLTNEEEAEIVEVINSPRFRDKSPWQIVPALADEDRYIASESSFYRVMRRLGLLNHRGRSRPRTVKRPEPLVATRPDQIYSWDITYLLSPIAGKFFYLYLVMDIFSRMITGWEIHERESGEFASDLIREICQARGIEKGQLIVHADNGGPMKGATLYATFTRLGITPSHSRPRVSDDNPFSEALFKTLKYVPNFPDGPFESLEAARAWVEKFVAWYNTEHLHSEIQFVTPESRHIGQDREILAKRKEVYEKAKADRPERWSGPTRDWAPVERVPLNAHERRNKKLAKSREKRAAEAESVEDLKFETIAA